MSTSSPSSPLAVDQIVGNYRIQKLLGRGGMGAVYLAEHPKIGRKVAVKVLHPALAGSERELGRFINEARAANAIRHPGIVQIFDFGTLPTGATYIIMEFLEGESLAARVARLGRLRLTEAVGIVAQTAEILGAAHAAGIVHRDLKPDNLFLVPDGRVPGRERVKVLDFGIAKLTQAEGASSLRTRTGHVVGTPRYMSPEQCRGTRAVDARADIYALGVILYELCCGRRPFLSEGHGELISMHLSTPPPRPRKHNPAIPPTLEGVILNALEKDARLRIPTMEALRQALRAVPAEVLAAADVDVPRGAAVPLSATPASTTDASRAPPTIRRRSPWVAPIVAMTVAVSVFIVGLSRRPSRPRLAPTSSEASIPAAPAQPAGRVPEPPPGPVARPPAPRMIAVGITSEPSGARVVRQSDGADVGVTPVRASWPAAEGVERLDLELPGYRKEPLAVPRDRDVNLLLRLQRLAPPPPEHKPRRANADAPERRLTPAAL
jgi:serine/threonine protein kinase